MLYPLKFNPLVKERVWGGHALAERFGKCAVDGRRYGESWELSAVAGDISVVANGEHQGISLAELVKKYGTELIGKRVFEKFGDDFPILIKLIDAQDDLSVQVHPDDNWAERRHGCFGKNEMWYVVAAEPGAKLYLGFSRRVTRVQYLEHLTGGTITDILNVVPVAAGDSFFIPAGTVHAIGGGTLIAEIQQTSDITYRLYDWGRVDSDGHERELHTQLAVDVIDFSGRNIPNLSAHNTEHLITTPYFHVSRFSVNGLSVRDYTLTDSFVVIIIVKGSAVVNGEAVVQGDTLLIPASATVVSVNGYAEIIECTV